MSDPPGSRPLGVVITYPYPIGERSTGGPRTLREIAWGLAALGDRIHVLTVSSNMGRRVFPRPRVAEELLGRDADAAYERHGVELERLAQNPLHLHLDALSVHRAVERLTREHRIDIVLGHYHEAAFLPRLLERRGVSFGFLATWQTYAPLAERLTGLGGAWWRWLRRRTILEPARAADVHFAISRFTRHELIDILGIDRERIVIAPLGVDRTFARIERRPPQAIEHLIYFGRYATSKGFGDALEALGKLAAQGERGWRLRLFGEGRRDLVEEAANRHGIADRVEVRGAVGDEELRRQLGWADLAILPSHAESFGLAIAEAQAAALPVIAYRAGAVPELVVDGVTGYLAPPGDTDALAALLRSAIDDPAAAHHAGSAGRERITTRFTWERTAKTIHATILALRDGSFPPRVDKLAPIRGVAP